MSVSNNNSMISIENWKNKKTILTHITGLKIEEALEIPHFFKKVCVLYMYGERPAPEKILSIRMRRPEQRPYILERLWGIFNHPIGLSFGKGLIQVFRINGIKR